MIAGYTGTQHRATYTCVATRSTSPHGSSRTRRKPGRSILIDENTRDRLDGEIEVQPEGELMLKGKNNPVNVYSVT